MARIVYFAAARDAAGGVRSEDVDAATIGDALARATERHGEPFAAILEHCTVVHEEHPVGRQEWFARAVGDADEVAVLPPVSGGQEGRFTMVDVAEKEETTREAIAVCRLSTQPATRDRLLAGTVGKGDATAAATIAATLAAKRTSDLIPMCHPVRMTFVGVALEPAGDDAIDIRVRVRGRDRTGFEMEAMMACSVAALTLYDFAKSEDPQMRVEVLRIVAKSGGKSGEVTFG